MTVNANLDYDTHKSYSFTVYATNDVGDSNKVKIEIIVYQVRTGRLVDSGVMGADYITDTKRYDDITERDGTFTYDTRDKKITFTLGDLIILDNFDLTKINSDGMILPVDIVVDKDGVSLDRNNTTNKNLIKLLRVFQSLDEDSDPTNGIEITQDTKNELTKSVNILDMNTSELKDMVENDVGKTFIKIKKARIHYIEKLRALGIDPELMKFITVWETENDDDEIMIEADKSNYDYDFTVDWGDGNTETYEDSTIASDNNTTFAIYPIDKSKFLQDIGLDGVTIDLTNCANNNIISFDHIGRPLTGDLSAITTAYPLGNLMTANCIIKLNLFYCC